MIKKKDLKLSATELAGKYTAVELAQELLDALNEEKKVVEQEIDRITITEDQLKNLFKIKGVNLVTGQAEKRGRPKSIKPENGIK